MNSNDIIDLVENSILDKLADTHTILTAEIVAVNEFTVDVKPVLRRLVDGEEKEYPVFTNVPPLFNYGGSNYIAFPLEKGDYCKLVVDERCLDNWYEGLDDKVPLEYRMFDYSDSSAWVCCKPKKSAIMIPQDGRTHQIGNTYQHGDYEHIGDREQDGDYILNGDQTINGGTLAIPSTSDLVIDDGEGGQVSLRQFLKHYHSQGDDGNGDIEVDTDAPTIP